MFVTLVQDLDRHRAVCDLPADRTELSDLALTARWIRRALVQDAPDLLGCRVDVERVAMFLHRASRGSRAVAVDHGASRSRAPAEVTSRQKGSDQLQQ